MCTLKSLQFIDSGDIIYLRNNGDKDLGGLNVKKYILIKEEKMGLYHELVNANKEKEYKRVTGAGIVDLDCAMFFCADILDSDDYDYAVESMEERILEKIKHSKE